MLIKGIQLIQWATDFRGKKCSVCIPLQWPKQDKAVLQAATAAVKTNYRP